MYKTRLQIFCVFILTILLTSCTESQQTTYPRPIITAIDYFYFENQNEKVLDALTQLTQEDLQKPENIWMRKLFTAAALCELSSVDSAAQIITSFHNQNLSTEASFWYNSIYGLILFRQNEFSKAYKVLSLTTSSDYKNIKALALNERILARISFSLSDQQKGIEWLLLSSKHFEQAGLPKSKGVNYKILGRHYANNKNYTEAIKLFRASEKIFLKFNDRFELFYVYINFTDYYIKTNDLKTAGVYANKCLEQCNAVSDFSMKAIVYNNIGEIEMIQKNYDRAMLQFNKTLSITNEFPTANIRKSFAHLNLAKILTIKKQYPEAIKHAHSSLHLLPLKGNTLVKHEIYNLLSANYKNIHKTETAYLYLDSASNFLDSAYNSISKTTKAYYDTRSDLMNASFKLDRLKDNERKNRNIYLTVILGLIILVSFIVVIYLQQQSKNHVLRALVKKNLKIIEDERKLNSILIQKSETKRTARKPNDQDKSEQIFNNFIQWIEHEKQYLRKDLNIELVAKELNTNREYLSRAINDKNFRFNDLINKYRIEEAIQIFSNKTDIRSKFGLSVIASEVGFNSNSVFIESFRRQTGLTPAQFRDSLKPNETA